MAKIFVGTEMDVADIAEELHMLAERFFRLDQSDRNRVIDDIESKLGPGTMEEVYSADLFAPIKVRAASKINGDSALTTKEGSDLQPGDPLAAAHDLVDKMTVRRKGNL